MKRILTFMLALAMTLTVMPMAVTADTNAEYVFAEETANAAEEDSNSLDASEASEEGTSDSEDCFEETTPKADIAETVLSGNCGATVTYVLDSEGILTISGTGAMYSDWSSQSAVPWHSKRSVITSVVINDGVTSIGPMAFRDCAALASVTLPDGLITISDQVFYNCDALESIMIPDSVTTIGANAFNGCDGLSNVDMPERLTTLGRSTFQGCVKITEITVPVGVTAINTFTFGGCSALETVTLAGEVTKIDSYAFQFCKNLSSLTILSRTRFTTGSFAFSGVPSSLVVYGYRNTYTASFASSNSYTFVELDPAVRVTGVTLDVEDTIVMDIGDSVTLNATVLPDNAEDKTISWSSSNQSAATVVDGIVRAGACGSTVITVTTGDGGYTDTVKVVVNSAYEGDWKVGDITWSYVSGLLTISGTGAMENYYSSEDTPWAANRETIARVVIEEGVTAIGSHAFADLSNCKSLSLPSSLVTINDRAFYGMINYSNKTHMTGKPYGEIIFPNNLQYIGVSAFTNMKKLYAVEFPDSLEHIGAGAFSSTDIADVTIGENVKYLGSNAFSCNLYNAYVYSRETEIGGQVFPSSVTVNCYADSDMANFCESRGLPYNLMDTSYVVESGVCGDDATWTLDNNGVFTVDGSGAMYDYAYEYEQPWNDIRSKFTKIVIGNEITHIGDNAFYFSAATEVVFEENSVIETIGYQAFCGSELETITLPSSLKELGKSCFILCYYLESVYLESPSSLEIIGNSCFLNCVKLTEFTIPESLELLDLGALAGCTSLKDIKFEVEDTKFEIVDGMLINNENKHLMTCIGFDSSVCVVPDGIEVIEPYAFYNAPMIEMLYIPKSVQKIYTYALYNLNKLTTLSIPFIGEERGISNTINSPFGAIFGTLSVSGEAELDGVVIQRYDIKNDKGSIIGCYIPVTLTDVTITDETVVPYGAFYNAVGLKNITFSEPLTEIKPQAFYKCTAKRHYTGTESAWNRIEMNGSYIAAECLGADLVTDDVVISVDDVYGGKVVSMACADELASIHYTLDGSEPIHKSEVYTKPLIFDKAGQYTITAVAVRSGYDNGSTAEEVVDIEQLPAPIASVNSGIITPGDEIVLSCSDFGADIYYTLDNSEPTADSILYTGPITVNGYTWIKAIAILDGYAVSKTAVYNFTDEYTVPDVDTLPASMVSKHSVTLGGEINNESELGIYELRIVYYKKSAPEEFYTVEANDDFTIDLIGLDSDTEYCYFARVINGESVGEGEILEFRTLTYEIPQAVSLSREGSRVQLGEKYQLYVEISPESAYDKSVSWSSTDDSIASVDSNGTVTAKSEGIAIITACSDVSGVNDSCMIVVYDKYVVGEYNLSELNMVTNLNYYDSTGLNKDTEGGTTSGALGNYMANWDGIVLEENDAYFPKYASPEFGYELQSYHIELDPDFHIQNAYILPRRNNYLDNDELKAAIMKYGAVTATMTVQESYFSGENKENYYYPESAGATAASLHEVAVVGWDDNYPADNFGITPPGDGAFIIKNSWGGGSMHDDGYVYVSYYDYIFNLWDVPYVFHELQTADNYNTIWQYDMLGATNKIGYEGSTWAANVFPENGKALEEDLLLKAVSFYTLKQDMTFEVYVVTDYTGSSSLTEYGEPSASGVMYEMGYHTIDLDEDVLLKAGTRFAVIVRLITDDDAKAHFYIELPCDSVYIQARANADESFLSPDGAEWTDITTRIENCNVCIKAFTDYADIRKAAGLTDTAIEIYGIDNENRVYTSDKVYSVDELETLGLCKTEAYIFESSEEETDIYSEYTYTFSYLMVDDYKSNYVSETEFPEKYDLRELDQVTPVRDQGGFGTCWSFGIMSSLESCLMKRAAEGAITEPEPDIVEVSGDADGNSVINLVDSALLLRYLAKWVGYDKTVVNASALDLNCDGSIDTLDATILARHIAGWVGYEILPIE